MMMASRGGATKLASSMMLLSRSFSAAAARGMFVKEAVPAKVTAFHGDAVRGLFGSGFGVLALGMGVPRVLVRRINSRMLSWFRRVGIKRRRRRLLVTGVFLLGRLLKKMELSGSGNLLVHGRHILLIYQLI
ncbi:hypothetical protein OIU77_000935 [Salix suchowensis]|uniref:Uncharacterized protein n=1 Tax=Salix suchowensis TaxID=1278906 RepID=A0ABQ9B9Q0_9ROSI|nr:hypothetical protein OIU77_000935 [Salix suchowensis]